MGGIFGGAPDIPAAPPVTTPEFVNKPPVPKVLPPPPAKVVDEDNAGQAEKIRRLYAQGKASTILTSAIGTPASGGSKNLGGT